MKGPSPAAIELARAMRARRGPDGWPVSRLRLEYWKARGKWRWRLRAGNHEIIASGEGYTRRADVLRAIELVKRSNAATVVHVKGPA